MKDQNTLSFYGSEGTRTTQKVTLLYFKKTGPRPVFLMLKTLPYPISRITNLVSISATNYLYSYLLSPRISFHFYNQVHNVQNMPQTFRHMHLISRITTFVVHSAFYYT